MDGLYLLDQLAAATISGKIFGKFAVSTKRGLFGDFGWV